MNRVNFPPVENSSIWDAPAASIMAVLPCACCSVYFIEKDMSLGGKLSSITGFSPRTCL